MPGKRSTLKSLLCFSSDQSDSSAIARHDGSQKRPPAGVANGTVTGPQRRRESSSPRSSTDDSDRVEADLLNRLKAMKIRNFKTLKDVALKGIKGEPIDDRTYLMERIIQLATDLPYQSAQSETLTKAFLTQLWDDLEHPPKSYFGGNFTFRQADGSLNNIQWPHIGAAGQPYARTVQPKMMQPVTRPDPGVIFDSLLVRKAFKPHPNQISSILFYVASIIIHDIFHTSHKDFAISETSSYLDLAPLYGSDLEQQMLVRTKKDGKLKADCFSDVRILGFPPGVGVLLVFFNRFHNQVATDLAKIDENGRFSSILQRPGIPTPANGEELYDEALFQTARLITTGLYVNIILKDYVRTILGLNTVDSKWNLDPRSEEGKALIKNKIPQALGNQVSAEFNLVYRWHSCISERDEQWTEDAYKRIAGDSANISMSELLMALQDWAVQLPVDPQQRPFHDIEREFDGRLPDDKLASIWKDSVDDGAGSFGAQHVPKVLRSVEMLGMVQARSWNLASLNEFREYFKLTRYEKFEEINPDPYIQEQLRNLYGHPDHVELYPGIVVEAAKDPMSPGSGLCTNFTISRAVLSDAVALVRSDRYHTVDHTPQNLTNYGFQAADYDTSIDYGCVFYKLVLNALPDHFSSNSIYAHYPLVVPSRNKILLEGLKQSRFYDFERPKVAAPTRVVNARDAVGTEALSNSFSLWSVRCVGLGGPGTTSMKRIVPSFSINVAAQEHWAAAVRTFFDQTIQRRWKAEQYAIGAHQQIELLRDIVNVAYVELFQMTLGISDAELEEIADGFDSKHLVKVLSAVLGIGSAGGPLASINGSHRKQIIKLASLIETKIRHAKRSSPDEINRLSNEGRFDKLIHVWGQQSLVAMSEMDTSPTDLAWHQILPDLALITVSASRLSAHFIESMLLSGSDTLSKSKTLLKEASKTSVDTLTRLIREVTTDQCQVTLATKSASTMTLDDGESSLAGFEQSQIIVQNLSGSIQAVSPEMKEVEQLHEACMRALLRTMGGLKDLERVPGPQGQLKHVRDNNGSTLYLNEKYSEYSWCPTMLKVRWKS